MKRIKVLVVSDSFKGSLTSSRIARLAGDVFEPLAGFKLSTSLFADGGEGSLDCVKSLISAGNIEISVTGIVGEKVTASYLVDGTTAYLESAKACGFLSGASSGRNPALFASDGLGDMIMDALGRGCITINIFLGGTATVDGGSGLMRALGVTFFDSRGEVITSGNPILSMHHADFSKLVSLDGVKFNIICDVNNPLFGNEGGIRIYGPQKGLKDSDFTSFEEGMKRWINILNSNVKSNIVDGNEPFTGAAGGLLLPFHTLTLCDCHLGFDWFRSFMGLDNMVMNADVVISGEGRIDRQSEMGKGVGRLALLCMQYSKPIYAVCGSAEGNIGLFEGIFPFVDSEISGDYAIKHAEELFTLKLKEIVSIVGRKYGD
jgi:glycerate kinase